MLFSSYEQKGLFIDSVIEESSFYGKFLLKITTVTYKCENQ